MCGKVVCVVGGFGSGTEIIVCVAGGFGSGTEIIVCVAGGFGSGTEIIVKVLKTHVPLVYHTLYH